LCAFCPKSSNIVAAVIRVIWLKTSADAFFSDMRLQQATSAPVPRNNQFEWLDFRTGFYSVMQSDFSETACRSSVTPSDEPRTILTVGNNFGGFAASR